MIAYGMTALPFEVFTSRRHHQRPNSLVSLLEHREVKISPFSDAVIDASYDLGMLDPIMKGVSKTDLEHEVDNEMNETENEDEIELNGFEGQYNNRVLDAVVLVMEVI